MYINEVLKVPLNSLTKVGGKRTYNRPRKDVDSLWCQVNA